MLPANASRIDFRLFIVELKSLKRYKNVFSLELFDLFDLNVRKGKDFLVGAIFGAKFSVFFLNNHTTNLFTPNCTSKCTK